MNFDSLLLMLCLYELSVKSILLLLYKRHTFADQMVKDDAIALEVISCDRSPDKPVTSNRAINPLWILDQLESLRTLVVWQHSLIHSLHFAPLLVIGTSQNLCWRTTSINTTSLIWTVKCSDRDTIQYKGMSAELGWSTDEHWPRIR